MVVGIWYLVKIFENQLLVWSIFLWPLAIGLWLTFGAVSDVVNMSVLGGAVLTLG